MLDWFLSHWAQIVSTIALLVSSSSFFLSYKVRHDGIILKLIPKFTVYFERADKKHHYDHFANKRGEVGYEVSVTLTIANLAPYTLEILEISSSNYFMTRGLNLDGQRGYRALTPNKGFGGSSSLIRADKEMRYSFTAFVPDSEHRSAANRLPDIALIVKTLRHSDPPVQKAFRIVRPVTPGLVVTEVR